MIINDEDKILIQGDFSKIIQDLTEIFCSLNEKMDIGLKNNPSIAFRAYTQALNDCIKYAPLVKKEAEKWRDSNNDQ